jgi:predicted membrane-bound dolichyl-phosphate-mannose-protein mannosyltransferase
MMSAAALGLAASTDFSAALILPPFLIYRYALQRPLRTARWSLGASSAYP